MSPPTSLALAIMPLSTDCPLEVMLVPVPSSLVLSVIFDFSSSTTLQELNKQKKLVSWQVVSWNGFKGKAGVYM